MWSTGFYSESKTQRKIAFISQHKELQRRFCACLCLRVNCFDLNAETSEIYELVAETFEHGNELMRFLKDRLIFGQLKIFSFSKRIVIYAVRY